MYDQANNPFRDLVSRYDVPTILLDNIPGGEVKWKRLIGMGLGVILHLHDNKVFEEAGVSDKDALLDYFYPPNSR